VSTSNEVYIVQALDPRQQDDTNEDMEMADAGQQPAILTAIAKTDSILELLPATIDIEAQLRKLLPLYDQDQLTRLLERGGELVQHDNESETDYIELTIQIPAPDVSIRKVWQRLCVSRTRELRKRYFIPTLSLLQSAWNSALAAYHIRAGGTGTMKRSDFDDVDDGAGELLPVKTALWRRLCSKDGSSLDMDQTVTWVVRNLWECMWEVPANEHTRTERLLEVEDIWRNALPREYRKDASVDKLEAGTYELYEEAGEEMIRWTQKSGVVPALHPTAAKPGKRKWHEKFRDSRNVKA
jgi:hypothetical protein